MAWGFMEIPPLLSVFAWLTNLFGNGMFWIKSWPSLFGALTYIVTGKIVLSLGGKYYSLFLAFLCFIFSGYLRVHYLFQPNFLEIFFWTMIAYGVIRYIQTGKNYWLYVTGISAGLGMISKYSVLFFIIGVLAGLLLTPQRKLFANKHLYLAALAGFIIFLPNIIWQYSFGFPVFGHMKELQQTQLQYISPVSFIAEQFMMFLPCVFVWLAGLWFVAFAEAGKKYRFIAWAYVCVIALLLYLHGKSYYSLGAYPVLIAFGAYWLEYITAKKLIALRYVFVIIPFVFVIQFIPVMMPVFAPEKLAAFYVKINTKRTGALHWEDLQDHPLPQDFADMLGWEEMAKKVSAAYHSLSGEEKKHTVIFCDNYGQAGAVTFYAKKYGIPLPYSTNASFLYWMPQKIHIDDLVLVTDDTAEMQHPFVKEFTSAILTDSITAPYARERGSLILVLKGANEKFNQMFSDKIAKAKAAFTSQ
jgi:hypothetical protein